MPSSTTTWPSKAKRWDNRKRISVQINPNPVNILHITVHNREQIDWRFCISSNFSLLSSHRPSNSFTLCRLSCCFHYFNSFFFGRALSIGCVVDVKQFASITSIVKWNLYRKFRSKKPHHEYVIPDEWIGLSLISFRSVCRAVSSCCNSNCIAVNCQSTDAELISKTETDR